MAATFPVSISFQLPSPQWQAVDPNSLGLDDVFVAALRTGFDGYAPVLTVRGRHGIDLPSLDEVADSSVQALRAEGNSADVVKRTRIDSVHAPAIVQLTEIDARLYGVRFDLYQAQVIEALIDSVDSRKQVMLSFAVTCNYGQFAVVGPEFESFMESVSLGGQAASQG